MWLVHSQSKIQSTGACDAGAPCKLRKAIQLPCSKSFLWRGCTCPDASTQPHPLSLVFRSQNCDRQRSPNCDESPFQLQYSGAGLFGIPTFSWPSPTSCSSIPSSTCPITLSLSRGSSSNGGM